MSIDRKAAINAYKERKSRVGIYTVRCAATGQAWVGQALDLDKIPNRLWFTLRQGGHPCASLQAAWRTHGEASLAFAAWEELDEEQTPYIRDAWLKERLAHWRAQLSAEAV